MLSVTNIRSMDVGGYRYNYDSFDKKNLIPNVYK